MVVKVTTEVKAATGGPAHLCLLPELGPLSCTRACLWLYLPVAFACLRPRACRPCLPAAFACLWPVPACGLTPYSSIDTWPGRRSGGMIVITSILGSLPFFLLLGFAGAIVLSLADMRSSDGEMTHDSQITQEALPNTLGTSEPSYTSVNRGPPLDRAEVYSSKLQD
ncbi:PREDICTED: uroplakin-3a [Galeopterus variegatus]|uniref:Uroplakin-3a n=1 Tax=Galeopterus variegatus TaxID=482537 RepID=A0ABM0RK52_GALVR|nr:PREDICTED: uroplakin-3a [Galeopterus variegatus]